jgi:hypothetical protein
MSLYKKLIVRFIAFIFALILMNLIYKKFFFEKDIQTHSDIINLVRKVVKDSCEVVYFGESSNFTSRDDDMDKRPISDFIADYYPNIKSGNVTKGALHAGIYYELLRNIPVNSKIKTVIVTMNLRSFDANWIYSNLETSLQKSIVLLKDHPPLYNRFLLSFKGYDIKTDQEREKQFKHAWKNSQLRFPYKFKYQTVTEWDKAIANNGIKNSDGSKNEELTILGCHYIKQYAFQIDTLTNPRIKYFDKIVILAKERKWNLVFNIIAENTEHAKELIGTDLTYLIKQNRDLLVKRYNKDKVIVVDNLECVENDQFINEKWITEHYTEIGRKIIAQNVADSLKRVYPVDFVKVYYKTEKPIEFTNNCEVDNYWSQFQTITEEKAFSGSKSSKTGQGQDYSLTFDYGIKNLPDSLKEVTFEFEVFQNEKSTEAKLVFELSGDNVNSIWEGTNLSYLTRGVQKWDKVFYKFQLPENFYLYKIIKIYIYNPSQHIVYIDDLNIKFIKQ